MSILLFLAFSCLLMCEMFSEQIVSYISPYYRAGIDQIIEFLDNPFGAMLVMVVVWFLIIASCAVVVGSIINTVFRYVRLGEHHYHD